MRVLVTGASRGIGAAIARRFAARHGSDARVALLGRSLDAPVHDALQGSLRETSRDVEAYGAQAYPFRVDLRDVEALKRVLHTCMDAMGGIDVLVNNASALWLRRGLDRMDMVHQVNARATLVCVDTCHPQLEASRGAIVTMSPPLRVSRLEWLSEHPSYTISKYSMSLATLAYASTRVRANCVWPRHTVKTAATRHLEDAYGVPDVYTLGRDPDDVAHAVYTVAMDTRVNAQCLMDDQVCHLPHTKAPIDLFAEPRVDPPLRE